MNAEAVHFGKGALVVAGGAVGGQFSVMYVYMAALACIPIQRWIGKDQCFVAIDTLNRLMRGQ